MNWVKIPYYIFTDAGWENLSFRLSFTILEIYTLILFIHSTFNKDDLNWISKILMASFFIVCLASIRHNNILTNCTFISPRTIRIKAQFTHPNLLASYLIMVIPLFFNWINKFKLLYFLFFTLGVIALIFTGSMGGAIAFFIGILIYCLSLEKLRRSHIFKILVISLIFILLMISGKIIHEKIKSIGLQSASHGRLFIWRSAFSSIKENPLFGTGLGTSHQSIKKYYFYPEGGDHLYPHAHNIYIDALLQTGILGGILSFIPFGYIFWKKKGLLRDQNTSIEKAFFIGLISILIHSIFDSTPCFFIISFLMAIFFSFLSMNEKVFRES
ncbi:MAG: O-antigen ligase family protein [Elusimicrobiota bacterium]